ncbi:hypothetical protein Ae201684_015163 [Aphanomyces euteiches]|uniref:Uncharacterized protein n=1 Tax=Aphanomyces euteiches TaxID=100861 RepID=A0A6G0WH73_9STRA|nr:hypothetical protein Ae201684_015163 [Aphanomyces euteiches]
MRSSNITTITLFRNLSAFSYTICTTAQGNAESQSTKASKRTDCCHCCTNPQKTRHLEALAVHNRWATFIVFGLGDPHLLESGQGRQDGTTDPDGVLALWRSDNLDLHGGRSQSGQFLGHTFRDTRVHGGTAGQHDVAVQVLTDIDIALHDGREGAVVDTRSFLTDQGRLEQHFRGTETFVADDNDVTIGQFVTLFETRRFGSGLHFLVVVESDVGQLFLDVTHDFAFGGGGEGVTTFGQDLHHEVGQVATSQVQTDNSVGKSITFVDGHSVGDTITRVQHATSGTAGSVQRQHGLDVHVHGRHVEGFEHDLGHAFTVGLGVQRSFRQQHRVFFRGDTQFVVESVVPNLFHIVPVGHNTVFNRVLQGQDTTLGLSFITDIGILLVHANHDTRVLGATDNGRKDGTGGIVTGKTGLAHTGTVVYDKSLNIIVSHGDFALGLESKSKSGQPSHSLDQKSLAFLEKPSV